MTPMSLTSSQDISAQIQAQSALLPIFSGPPPTVVFQTNSVANQVQGGINLINGPGVTFSNPSGNQVTAAAMVTFDTNGVANATQGSLNLVNGLNISITNTGNQAIIAVAQWNVDISAYTPGTLSNGQELLRYNFGHNQTLPINLAGSYATADVTSAGNVICSMFRNGVSIGTINFNTSATGGFTFSAGVSFNPGDVLTVLGPNPADISLAGVSFTLVSTRTA